MKRIWIAALVAAMTLAGCSAIKVAPGAQSIELSNAKPSGACRYLGEAIGSQGNWFTGDYTSNKHLMEGARNDLRNQAAAMGGNYVWIQNVSNAQAHGALGTSNTTTVGNVYACGVGRPMSGKSEALTSPTPTVAGRQSITTPEAGVLAGPHETPPVSGVQQVLAAQKIAQGQRCADVQPVGGGSFQAACGSYTLIIQCDGAMCRPVRTVGR